MTKTPILKQKQVGLLLMVFGGFLGAFIFIFVYFNVIRITGFPEFLPAEGTAAFFEAPAGAIPRELIEQMNVLSKMDWEKDVFPQVSRVGIALLTSQDPPGSLKPIALLEIIDEKNAPVIAEKLKAHKLESTYVGSVLVVALNPKLLTDFLALQEVSVKHLGSDRNFIRVRQNISGEIFAFVRPELLPPETFQWISRLVPQMPEITNSVTSIGATAKKNGNAWEGTTYALLSDMPAGGQTARPSISPASAPDSAYRALLLPYVPDDFDFLIAGRNASRQIENIDDSEIFASAAGKFLPSASLKEIHELMSGEFALTIGAGKIFVILESADNEPTREKIRGLRELLIENAARFAPIERGVVLPDGTRASELVPDPAQISTSKELFEGIEIHGIEFGKTAQIYDAFHQNKWFISSDLAKLKKALALTKTPGAVWVGGSKMDKQNSGLRESELYRGMLQPILKNPELLGIARFPTATFSFSKRTFTEHMETNFILRFE